MKINSNLQKLTNYDLEIVDINTKRLHANESAKPILPLEVLTKNAFENVNFYPEICYQDLTIAAAKFYNSNIAFTIPTNGSDEGLDLLIRTACNIGDNIITLNPTFSMYRQYCISLGVNNIEYDLDENFTLNIQDFINFCNKNEPKMIFIPNPLAPTGGITNKHDLINIITSLPNSLIVIDEAYIEFSQEQSAIEFVRQYNNVAVTRTLSKFFGLAGIRLGFIFSGLKDEISKIKSPYNVNEITCKIALNLFKNLSPEIIKARLEESKKSKQKLILWLKQFKEIDKIYDTNANFLFIKLNCNAGEFANKILKDFDIKIKAFSAKFENFCRISF